MTHLTHPPSQSRTTDRISLDLAHELVELLSEALVEIWNQTDSRSPVVVRLREMRERIQKAELTAGREVE